MKITIVIPRMRKHP